MGDVCMLSYDHYPCQVEFERYFVQGNLEGMAQKEKMGFMTWHDACAWAGCVTRSHRTNYVILEMRNLKTGELEKF